uniref:GA-binding protein subunit beta-1 n=2 Tax=Dendroctonus ponderosae TaxID=77166 RepID=A0AAR5QHX1_DENPD
MIKIFENGTRPIKYILTGDDTYQELPEVDTVNNSPLANINKLGKQLHKFASEGNIREVRALLAQGSPFISDWLGTSPLHLAAQNNNVEVCEALLKGGILKDARNKVDRTPLHLAAYEGHYGTTETLLKHGADINCKDMLNMTPLHWAVQNGHTAVVELLLRNGADISTKNKFDLTPQDIALQIDNMEMVELLQVYESNSEAVAQSLMMQLNGEDLNSHIVEISEENSNVNQLGDEQFRTIENNNEHLLFNIGNNMTVNCRSPLNNKDQVFINLKEKVNSEIPDVNQKVNRINGTTISDFKIDRLLEPEEDSRFSAIQLLQEHGISMLPNDTEEESSILNAVMESGHSVVLTDVGKEVLNTVKQQEEKRTQPKPKPKKIITVSPEQFLSLTNGQLIRNTNIQEPYKVIPLKSGVRRIYMKKSRPTPFGNMIKLQCVKKPKTELEKVRDELAQAKKEIEDYKWKLTRKDSEIERYKTQLKLLMHS